MCSPKGVGPESCVPGQRQVSQAPRKVWAATVPGHGSVTADISGAGTAGAVFCLLPQALALALAVAIWLAFPSLGHKLQSHLVCL